MNAIQDLVDVGDLMVMTTSAEHKLTTGADEVVAPGKVGFKAQSWYGTGDVATQVAGSTAVFFQRKGPVVRDLSYEFTKDGYTGNDLTVYASHLVRGFTIIDAAFQQAPYSCVWMVRSDGALISLTYVREQEVVGWALHSTNGRFESVCVVPEGDVDAVYVTVRRVIEGVDRVYVERLAERDLTDQRDAFFVDSGLTYDGRLTTGTQTLTGGTLWDDTEELTLTASTAQWVGASDVGDQVRLVNVTEEYTDGDRTEVLEAARVEVIEYVSATVVKARAIETIPVSMRGVAPDRWEMMRSTITGLDHLEGEVVVVLADGGAEGDEGDLVVTGGAIDLPHPAAVVHVGLGYRSLLESLAVNVQGQETVRDRPKAITKVMLLVEKTRGLSTGCSLDIMDEFKMREFEDLQSTIALYSGPMDVNTTSTWDANGHFFVLQTLPLPATILSMTPDVSVAGVG